MFVDPPKEIENWPDISEQDFKEFLKNCADYRRGSTHHWFEYTFVHNGDLFDVITAPFEMIRTADGNWKQVDAKSKIKISSHFLIK